MSNYEGGGERTVSAYDQYELENSTDKVPSG